MFGLFTTKRHYIKNLLNLDIAKILTHKFTMFGELYWPLSCADLCEAMGAHRCVNKTRTGGSYKWAMNPLFIG